MVRQRGRALRQDDTGAAAVEFALVSTLLFALLMGIVAFGFALFEQQSAAHAAREGARVGAVGMPDTGTKQQTCDAFEAFVKKQANGTVVDSVAVGFGEDGTEGQADNKVYGTFHLTVNYTVDLSMVAWFPGIPGEIALASVARSSIEQPSPADLGTGCA